MLSDEAWRLLPFDCGSSTSHIEMSDALVRCGREPTVWWHASDHPTLILGAAQPIDPEIIARARSLGARVAKRHAGGTSVLATREVLGLDVMLPRHHPLVSSDVVESYRWLGDVWTIALRILGADARIVSVEDARATLLPPEPVGSILRAACFGTLSPYEVTVDGRKAVGLAQVRRAHNVLLLSGVHMTLDAASLVAMLSPVSNPDVVTQLRQRATGLDETIHRKLTVTEIMQAFARALREYTGVTLHAAEWSNDELAFAHDIGRMPPSR